MVSNQSIKSARNPPADPSVAGVKSFDDLEPLAELVEVRGSGIV
jgi:hypothetical protein